MCSIVGVWSLAPAPADLEAMVASGLATLRRRGPDEQAVLTVSPGCVMGGNRLIIRGGPGIGSMPFVAGNRAAFYNGEIYNYARWAPQASSDGEAVLPAYAAAGPACFRDFDGEFAISLWDGDRQTLLLARDHFGAKPLYFSFDGRQLLWASSATAIRRMVPHPFCASVRGPHYRGIATPNEPYTSFRGIWQVPPGHVLTAGPQGVRLFAFNLWEEATIDSDDPTEVFDHLEESLRTRLAYDGTIAIRFSGGIDRGIIAFMADRLGIPYHLFSVVEMMGRPTPETPFIYERLRRLRRPTDVTLLSCGEPEIAAALAEMYEPDYYDSAALDNGNLPAHTVFQAIHRAGLRVAIDGSGGDELFHGYPHRDEFGPIAGWPQPWRGTRYFYSLFTSLPVYAAKADRAGAHFSIETRYPYLSAPLLHAAFRLQVTPTLKWPLRRFLLERLDYGPPTDMDLFGKKGFTMLHTDNAAVEARMLQAWCSANGLTTPPTAAPALFPFATGVPLPDSGPVPIMT